MLPTRRCLIRFWPGMLKNGSTRSLEEPKELAVVYDKDVHVETASNPCCVGVVEMSGTAPKLPPPDVFCQGVSTMSLQGGPQRHRMRATSKEEENTMADQQHLAVLQQGVAPWNAWRRQYPEIHPDLSGADLSEADLSGADLRHANLMRANLSHAYLSEASLDEANLRDADLTGANLREVLLTLHTDYTLCSFSLSHFTYVHTQLY